MGRARLQHVHIDTSTHRRGSQVVLVTGANAGIGSRTAAKLAGTGATVVLACRSVEKAEAFRASQTADKTNNMVVLKLDLASITSIRDFVVAFKAKFTKLDVLILNGSPATNP